MVVRCACSTDHRLVLVYLSLCSEGKVYGCASSPGCNAFRLIEEGIAINDQLISVDGVFSEGRSHGIGGNVCVDQSPSCLTNIHM